MFGRAQNIADLERRVRSLYVRSVKKRNAFEEENVCSTIPQLQDVVNLQETFVLRSTTSQAKVVFQL